MLFPPTAVSQPSADPSRFASSPSYAGPSCRAVTKMEAEALIPIGETFRYIFKAAEPAAIRTADGSCFGRTGSGVLFGGTRTHRVAERHVLHVLKQKRFLCVVERGSSRSEGRVSVGRARCVPIRIPYEG